MELEIKKLDHHDVDQFIDVLKVFEEAFEMVNFVMPDKEYLQKLLDKSDFMIFVAIDKGQVIGGLTSYTLMQYYSTKPLAYIYDLAVKIAYQRKGVGKQLISGITQYCTERGFEEVFVQADEVDDHAVDFYRSTPITEELMAHQFSYIVNQG